MGDLRRIPFFIAVILIFLVVGVETGSGLVQSLLGLDAKGLGVPYLGILDSILLFLLAFMTLALFVPERITGRIQGIATLIFGLLLLLLAISLILAAIAKLTLMLGLLLSGFLGYVLAGFANFPKSAMLALLSTVMLLKIGMAVALVLAQQRFLENKWLVFLILTSLVANVIVSFLLGFVPRFLTSITDAVAALVVGILGAIWMLVLVIFAIPAILKAVSLRAFQLNNL
jgi:hypothetical protein